MLSNVLYAYDCNARNVPKPRMSVLRQLQSPMLLSRVHSLWQRWSRPVQRVVQWVLPGVLLVFIGYNIERIGVSRVWHALPTAIPFYFVLLLPFFLPPLGDFVVYRGLLGTDKLSYPIFLRKQCLSAVVLDFSGDAYFFLWCRRNLGLPTAIILHAIKDSSILSAAASSALLGAVLVLLAASGALSLLHLGAKSFWALLVLGSVPVILVLVLILGGRRTTTLAYRDMARIFAIHLVRATAVLSLRFLMWDFSGALPSAFACLEFVTIGFVVTRVPVLPNKGLVYAGAAIVAAGALHIPQSGVAAVVVIENVAFQLASMAVIAHAWFANPLEIAGSRATDVVSESMGDSPEGEPWPRQTRDAHGD